MREKENKMFKELEVEEIIDRKLAEMVGEHFKIKKQEELHGDLEPNKELQPQHPKPHHHLKHKEPIKLEFEFDEKIDTIINVFGDESTAEAIIKSLKESPIEIQVLAQLIIDLHERLDEALGE